MCIWKHLEWHNMNDNLENQSHTNDSQNLMLSLLTDSPFPFVAQLSEDVEGSILYLDAGCVESFKFLGAFPLLLELGVHAIYSLEEMSSLDAVSMFVIMISQLLDVLSKGYYICLHQLSVLWLWLPLLLL